MINETIKIKVKTEDDVLETDSVFDEINWQMEEPNLTPKSNDWYWALAIFGLAIIVFSILLKNYLFIVIVVLIALIFYFSKNKELELINFRLDAEGLHIDGKLYHYEGFESFWIFPAHTHATDGATTLLHEREIAFRYKRRLAPLLIVPFHDNDESQIRKILTKHLSENEEEESMIDLLRKRFF